MTNYAHGHEAEKVAAEYLKDSGYKIIALNWRHKRAEIDIIARKKRGPLTFVEVKYRETAAQGGGLDYITPTKLSQMAFAADLYVTTERYDGEYTLAAIEVSGPSYTIGSFISELI